MKFTKKKFTMSNFSKNIKFKKYYYLHFTIFFKVIYNTGNIFPNLRRLYEDYFSTGAAATAGAATPIFSLWGGR